MSDFNYRICGGISCGRVLTKYMGGLDSLRVLSDSSEVARSPTQGPHRAQRRPEAAIDLMQRLLEIPVCAYG